MNPRPSWQDYFLSIAAVVATRSTCPKRQVGSLLVKENRILTTGFNGSVTGGKHCTEIGCQEESGHCMTTIHSEENAMLAAAKFGISIDQSTLYCTFEPCARCKIRLHQAGVIEFVYPRFTLKP